MHVHADALTAVWFAAMLILVLAAIRAVELAFPDSPFAKALAVIH